MKQPVWAALCVGAVVSGCSGTGTTGSDQIITTLPEGVLAIAAPNQNLNAVRISPTDGCYEYRYVGAVETTFLPLRSKDGRPICSRAPDPETTA